MIYRLAFGGATTLLGTVRLEVPEDGLAAYEAVFTGPEIGPGVLVVRDLEVPPPRRSTVIELRGDGVWIEFTRETAHEHWSFGLEAFGLRVDEPSEEIGERIAVGYDLEWETPDQVHGELLVGRSTFPVSTHGTFEIVDGSR